MSSRKTNKMNCTWKSAGQCLKLFKSVQHTNNMVNILFDQHGLNIMSMDGSKTSLVRLRLKPEYFDSYRCSQPLVFGIYTETLTSVLQKAKQTTVQWKSTNDNALTVVMADKDFKTEITLRSIQIEDDHLDVPELEDDIAFTVDASVLRDWVDKVLMTKADVAFDITNQEFACSSEAIEVGEIKHIEPVGGERVKLVAFRNPVNIALSFNSTRSMAVFAAAGGQTCFVGFSNNQPSRIQVNLGHESTLCLYVAPKILDDE